MPEPSAKRARRFRRRHVVLFVFALLLGAGILALRWFTRTEHLTALLMEQTRSALGTDLALDGRPHYDLWPKLHLVLPRASLKSAANPPWASSESLEVVVPWRILWSDHYEIEQVNLVKPVLDLDALAAWLGTRPPSTATPPDVRFSVHVENGTVVAAGKPVAQGLKLDFASTGDVAAWLARLRAQADASALVPPLNGSADASRVQAGTVVLEGVHVEVRDDPPAAARQ
jgi:hypothetical protein